MSIKIFLRIVKFLIFFTFEIGLILILYYLLTFKMFLLALFVAIIAYIVGDSFFVRNKCKNIKEFFSSFIE